MNISLVLRRLRFEGKSSEISQRKVIGRLNKICRIISEKFPEVQRPDQIKLKHLQYVRNEGLAGYSAATTVDYKRTIVILVEEPKRCALNRDPIVLCASRSTFNIVARIITSVVDQTQKSPNNRCWYVGAFVGNKPKSLASY